MTDQNLIDEYFSKNKKPFLNNFYKLQRINENILIKNKLPLGGKWSLDEENRKKLPKNIKIPPLPTVKKDINIEEIKLLVDKKFKAILVCKCFFLPTNRKLALTMA